MLLGPLDLLVLSDDIILKISSLFVAVILKESLYSVINNKISRAFMKNLIFQSQQQMRKRQ